MGLQYCDVLGRWTMTEEFYEVDNRDESTTWLQLSNGDYVEVTREDLIGLLFNMAENQGEREEEVVNDIVNELERYLEKEGYYNERGMWNKGSDSFKAALSKLPKEEA